MALLYKTLEQWHTVQGVPCCVRFRYYPYPVCPRVEILHVYTHYMRRIDISHSEKTELEANIESQISSPCVRDDV